jgi:outer membrane receptor for monomeric catechols
VELGITWTATPQVSFYVNGAFSRDRFGYFVIENSGGNTVLTGNRLPIAPDRIINGEVVITPSPVVNLRVDVKHVGDVMVNQGNTFALAPYTLVDASTSWYRGPARITLSAHNLLTEDYYWNGDTSLAESADPGAPRQVLLTTSFSFR